MSIDVRHEVLDGVDVVHIDGDVDIYSAPALRDRLITVIGQDAHDVVVDLSGVPVLDSMGLGVLVGAMKRARTHGGIVRLAGANPLAMKALRITGLTKVFNLYPDVAGAVAQPHDLTGPGSRRFAALDVDAEEDADVLRR